MHRLTDVRPIEYFLTMANTNDTDCGAPDCEACHFARTQGVEHSTKSCTRVGARRAVQAPALVTPAITVRARTVTLEVDAGVALGVGLSLQMMVRDGRIPPVAAPPYAELAALLVRAVRP